MEDTQQNTGNKGRNIDYYQIAKLAIAIVGLICVCLFLKRCADPKVIEEKDKIDIGEMTMSIRQCAKLCTFEQPVCETGIYKGYTGALEKKFFGTMRFGVDLRQAQVSGDTLSITVVIPHAQLLDEDFLDERKTQTIKDDAWTSFTNDEREACKQDAIRKMKKKFLEEGKGTADIQAATEIRNLLKRKLGYRGQVEVNFK